MAGKGVWGRVKKIEIMKKLTILLFSLIIFCYLHGQNAEVILQEPHYLIVQGIDWSSDNKYIVSYADNVKIWDAKSKLLIQNIEVTSGELIKEPIRFFNNNKTFIIADSYSLSIYNLDNFNIEKQFESKNKLTSYTISPDQNYIFAAYDDYTIKKWDIEKSEFEIFNTPHDSNIDNLVFINENEFVTQDENGNLLNWNCQTMQYQNSEDFFGTFYTSFDFKNFCSTYSSGSIVITGVDDESSKQIKLTEKEIISAKYSKSGKYLAVASSFAVFIIDIENREILKQQRLSHFPLCLVFSPDEKSFAVGMLSGKINIFSTQPFNFEVIKLGADISSLSDMAFNSTDNILAANSNNIMNNEDIANILKFKSTLNGKNLKQINSAKGKIYQAKFNLDFTQIAFANDYNSISLHNSDGSLQKIINTEDVVTALNFSPDSDFLCYSVKDKYIGIYNLIDDSLEYQIPINDIIWDIKYSNSGKSIVAKSLSFIIIINTQDFSKTELILTDLAIYAEADYNKNFVLYHSTDKKFELSNLDFPYQNVVFKGHTDKVIDFCSDIKSKFIYSIGYDYKLIKWDIDGNEIASIKFDEYLLGLDFNPKNNLLYSYSLERGIIVIDPEKLEIINSFFIENRTIPYIFEFSENGDVLFFSENNSMYLFETENYTKICRLYSDNEDTPLPSMVEFGKDSSFFITSLFDPMIDKDFAIRVIDLNNYTLKSLLKGHYQEVNKIKFSDDGKYLFSCSNDGTVIQWNFNENKIINSFSSHFSPVTDFTLANENQNIAYCDNQNNIFVWDYENKLLINWIEAETDTIINIIYSNDDNYLFCATKNSLIIYDTKDYSLIKNVLLTDNVIYRIDNTLKNNYILINGTKIYDVESNTLHEINTLTRKTIFHFHVDKNLISYLDKDGYLLVKDIKNKQLYKIASNITYKNFILLDDSVNYLYLTGDNSAINFFEISKEEYIGKTFSQYLGGGLFSLDQNNYYLSNKKTNDFVAFKIGNRVFPVEQFDLKYNRPDKVLESLPWADTTLIPLYHAAYQKRLKKMKFTEEMLSDEWHVPDLEITNIDEIPYQTSENKINLNISAKDTLYNLDRLNIWVNDVPVYGIEGISLRNQKINSFKKELEVELSSGENKIQVSVLNVGGAESYKETVYTTYTPETETKPDLYIVSIGVSNYKDANYNLKYADDDAQAVADLFKTNSADYGKIENFTLLNENVTVENIQKLKTELQKTKVDDKVIVFFAGHGLLDDSLDYYLATYNTNFKNPKEGSLPYDSLESILDGIPARNKLLFMDACHSGELDKEDLITFTEVTTEQKDVLFRGNEKQLGMQYSFELMKELFTDLRRSTGATVISSAGGTQLSAEADEWENGAFTYCLLQGLKDKKAESDGETGITVSELMLYLETAVPELTNNTQKPTSRSENLVNDFRVW